MNMSSVIIERIINTNLCMQFSEKLHSMSFHGDTE